MDSFVDKLRMNNIFPSGGSNPFGPPQEGGFDYNTFNNVLQRLQQPILDENQKNRNFQLQMMHPQLQNIASSVISNQPQNVNYRPSPSDFAPTKFQEEGLNLKEKLGEEGLGLKKQQLAEKSSTDTSKVASTKREDDIKQQRADVYKFKATHPEMKIMMPKGGNITAVDPITGKTMDLGISTGSMSDVDKMELTGQQQQERISSQGDVRKELQNTRGNQALENIGARIIGQKELQSERINKPETPVQDKVKYMNNAKRIANTRPDLAPFIQSDPTGGSFTITAPSTGFFGHSGPTNEQYKELNDLIYSDSSNNESSNKKEEIKPVKSKYKVTVE
jgi:hypothetical protein